MAAAVEIDVDKHWYSWPGMNVMLTTKKIFSADTANGITDSVSVRLAADETIEIGL